MKLPRDASPILLLLLAGFFCYGADGIRLLGFYHDDWTILSYLHFAPAGLFGRMGGLLREFPAALYRPAEFPVYAGLFGLFGLHPLGWQLALMAVNVALAFAVYRIASKLGAPREASMLSGLLFLVWPNKDATMFWPVTIVVTLSLLAVCVSYLWRLDYLETGKPSSLAAALGALLVGFTCYDQCLFFSLLWLIPPKPCDKKLRGRIVRSFVAAVMLTGAWLGYKMIFVPYFLKVALVKSPSFSAGHFMLAYWHGLLSNAGPELIRYSARAVFESISSHPWAAMSAIALPWAVFWSREPNHDRGESLRCIAHGAAIFVLGYLPIAISDYDPNPFNHLNRINQASAVGFVLVATGCTVRWLRPRRWKAILCVVGALLLCAHVRFAGIWSEAYRRELEVRDLVARFAGQWPADATLFVLLPQRQIAGKAPVFLKNWDISGATQLWTEDPARKADVIDPKTEMRPEGLFSRNVLTPYPSARLLDVQRQIFTSFDARNFRRSP